MNRPGDAGDVTAALWSAPHHGEALQPFHGPAQDGIAADAHFRFGFVMRNRYVVQVQTLFAGADDVGAFDVARHAVKYAVTPLRTAR